MLPFSILRLYPVGLVKPQLADNKHTGQVLSLSLVGFNDVFNTIR